ALVRVTSSGILKWSWTPVPLLRGSFVAKYIPPAETLTDSVPCSGALEFRTDTLSGMASLRRSVRRRSIGSMEDNPPQIRESQCQNDTGGKKRGTDVKPLPACPSRPPTVPHHCNPNFPG